VLGHLDNASSVLPAYMDPKACRGHVEVDTRFIHAVNLRRAPWTVLVPKLHTELNTLFWQLHRLGFLGG
jgi:hypothetical protein